MGWQLIDEVLEQITHDTDSYYRIIPIAQSTGFGKTRSCFDLMKVRRVVYFPCSCNTPGSTIPNIFNVMIDLLQKACAESASAGNKFAATIVEAIYLAAENFNCAKSLMNAQLNESTFCSSLLQALDEVVIPSKKVHFEVDEETESRAAVSRRKNPCRASDKNLIIFFDDVSVLSQNSSQKVISPIRCLTRAINARSSDNGVVFAIYASTTSNLNHISPGQACSRTVGKRDVLPLFEFFLMDQFSGKEDSHPYFYGRPLWFPKWKEFQGSKGSNDEADQALVDYAAAQLLNFTTSSLRNQLPLATFAVRFALNVTQSVAEDLVAHHLATLLDITRSDDAKVVEGSMPSPKYLLTVKYQSESVLAEVAARFMSKVQSLTALIETEKSKLCGHSTTLREVLLEMLKNDFGSSSRSFFTKLDKGMKGEFVSSVSLAFTMDALREDLVRKNSIHGQWMSQPVNAKSFMDAICPNSNKCFDHLENYEVNFTHFVQMNSINQYTPFEVLYNRRAAVCLGGNNPRFNLLLIFKKKNCKNTDSDKFIFVLIDSKDYSDDITKGLGNKFLDNIVSENYNFIKDGKNVIAVVLSVGGSSPVTASITPKCESVQFPRSSPVRSCKSTSNNASQRLSIATCLQTFKKLTDAEKLLLWSLSSRSEKFETPEDASKLSGSISLYQYEAEYGRCKFDVVAQHA